MMYRSLKRTWSHGYANYIPRMREVFPELSKIDNEEMCKRWIKLDIEFYCEKQKKVPFLIRFTLPFALIAMLLMLVILPVKFMITGTWYYNLNNENRLLNWLKSLKLQ